MKSLLKNSRQSFITRVSYGMKSMVVLPEDSKSRSRGFNKPAKNFFFLTKIKFAAAKINQTISLSPDNALYQSFFSIFFVCVVKVPWHMALDSQFCFIVLYMECTLQSQRWLIPETRVIVEL